VDVDVVVDVLVLVLVAVHGDDPGSPRRSVFTASANLPPSPSPIF
jgi:hypothetical protein